MGHGTRREQHQRYPRRLGGRKILLLLCPEIYNFYVEDDKVVVECSEVEKIRLHCDGHPTRIVRSEDGKLTRAEFTIGSEWTGAYKYVRVTVIDKDGKHAWTNPIYLD